jgi:hypothetical protein
MYPSLLRSYHTYIEIPYHLKTNVLRKQNALLLVVRITSGLQGTDVIGLEPVTHRLLLHLLKYSLP